MNSWMAAAIPVALVVLFFLYLLIDTRRWAPWRGQKWMSLYRQSRESSFRRSLSAMGYSPREIEKAVRDAEERDWDWSR